MAAAGASHGPRPGLQQMHDNGLLLPEPTATFLPQVEQELHSSFQLLEAAVVQASSERDVPVQQLAEALTSTLTTEQLPPQAERETVRCDQSDVRLLLSAHSWWVCVRASQGSCLGHVSSIATDSYAQSRQQWLCSRWRKRCSHASSSRTLRSFSSARSSSWHPLSRAL